MIKVYLLCNLIIFIAYSFENTPKREEQVSELSLIARIFKSFPSYKIMGEYESGHLYQNKDYRLIKTGAYFLNKNAQQWGAFISNVEGLRHDDDWILKNGKWRWRDTSSRNETIANLSYSKRFRASIFSDIVYEIRSDFQYNFFNDQQVVILKPSVFYFFLKNGVPLWSLNFSPLGYFPLNFSNYSLYKYGIYSSFLYHYKKSIILGISHKYRIERWSESKDFRITNMGKSYIAKNIVNHLSLSLIFKY